MPLYPLIFEPIYKPKVWGGRTLENLDRTLPDEQPIGESWELADLSATSVSGGGGDPERSVLSNGPLAGCTLRELIQRFGSELMGRLSLNEQGDFPLLVKFLDARTNLSVQVHPSPAYAAAHPDAHLKSEAWYIVEADAGAVIYKGVREGVTPQRFREAIANRTLEQMLIELPVRAGDCHYLPSGTCHALGAGIVAAEVQTPSDTTFRVYDWGRQGRELHIEQAMQCIDFGPPDTKTEEHQSEIARKRTRTRRLCQTPYFRIEKVEVSGGYSQPLVNTQPVIWMMLQGCGRITCSHVGTDVTPLQRGQTLLLPPGMEDAHLHVDKDTTWLEVSFPQAMADLIA